MAYSRQPQVVIANGGALKQTPAVSSQTPPGIVPVELEALIATTTNLGVVQVGSGLSITPSGILSATGGSSSFINVTLTNVDYTATADDYYIGATKKEIDITLPLGITGKVYVIKNQATGNIKVKCSGGQTLDTSSSKTLGSESSIIVVIDGSRWNVI
jgi:hypothetical protein